MHLNTGAISKNIPQVEVTAITQAVIAAADDEVATWKKMMVIV